jgi:hypothetical protein
MEIDRRDHTPRICGWTTAPHAGGAWRAARLASAEPVAAARHDRSPASRDRRVSRGARIARRLERCALAHTEGPCGGADSDSDAAHRRLSASALTTVC